MPYLLAVEPSVVPHCFCSPPQLVQDWSSMTRLCLTLQGSGGQRGVREQAADLSRFWARHAPLQARPQTLYRSLGRLHCLNHSERHVGQLSMILLNARMWPVETNNNYLENNRQRLQ